MHYSCRMTCPVRMNSWTGCVCEHCHTEPMQAGLALGAFPPAEETCWKPSPAWGPEQTSQRKKRVGGVLEGLYLPRPRGPSCGAAATGFSEGWVWSAGWRKHNGGGCLWGGRDKDPHPFRSEGRIEHDGWRPLCCISLEMPLAKMSLRLCGCRQADLCAAEFLCWARDRGPAVLTGSGILPVVVIRDWVATGRS